VEDVVLNRRDDATERMIEFAATLKAGGKKEEATLEWRSEPVAKRLRMRWCTASRNGSWKIPKKRAPPS
jgi:cobalamin-dependent methionine synthase I